MDITIHPGKLQGKIQAIASKSQAHRLLICASFSQNETTLFCTESNQDIEATVRCLNALGADIRRTEFGYIVTPISSVPEKAYIDCGESGSTLRFLLPVVCALGINTTIHMSGRLPYRPLSPLWEELERMGCSLSKPNDSTIQTMGKLRSGEYQIAGNISSQFISGLLFALALLSGESKIKINGKLESAPYVDMTRKALLTFGVSTTDYKISGSYPFTSPGSLSVEGDWSNSAFFIVSTAIGSQVCVENLDVDSPQGDRSILDILEITERMPVISAADIPDLVPILAVYFSSKAGAIFTDISRLRLKESDRVASTENMLTALGIHVVSDENTIKVFAGQIHGGTVNACNDHRIAMSAAIAATIASAPITILGAECVSKSYPSFWQEYKRLGGKYEQYIR